MCELDAAAGPPGAALTTTGLPPGPRQEPGTRGGGGGGRVGRAGGPAAAVPLTNLTGSLTTPLPPGRTAVCPGGHLTHAFLACDPQSRCWGREPVRFGLTGADWDVPTAATCRPSPPSSSSLTSLPPSFACADGSQRVPYTLVCDYGPDCQDGSDEDFCRFPECPADRALLCGASPQVGQPGYCYSRPP